MNIFESFRVAFGALVANKMRAFLTMLGVIIGVMAVIILISIGQGVKSDVTGQISGLGSNLLFVLPGRMGPDAQHGGGGGMTFKLVPSDVDLIKRQSVFAQDVVGNIESPTKVKYKNNTLRTVAFGTTAGYPVVFDRYMVDGKFFNESQVQAGRRVTVLGKTVVDGLFGGEDPIGKRITIGDQKFLVVGVMDEKGQFMGQDFDDAAYIPLSTAAILVGNDRLSMIVVKARDENRIEDTENEIERILSKRYTDDDFTVFTQGETLSVLQSILGMMTLMLAGIASISLLVGGIGIMNIMLVSVTERTREIGLRKAVGAKTSNIMTQFVIEAIFLSVFGGMLGILAGIGGSALLSRWLPAETPIWAILLAFGFSAAVGIFFGVYPAWKASRLDPIDALRYE